MILFSTVLRFWQEMKSIVAAHRLQSLVTNTATVVRPDGMREVREDRSSKLLAARRQSSAILGNLYHNLICWGRIKEARARECSC